MAYHLAQINIGILTAPLDTPQLADFVNALDEINALADGTPGFIWRLKGAGNSATDLRPYPDDRILINMSVWQDIESLFTYTYQTAHTPFLKRRGEWFTRMTTPIFTLWWVPVSHTPTPAEGKTRLDYMEAHGPTPYAFTFKKRFTAEEAATYH